MRDMTGQRFGRLVVESFAYSRKRPSGNLAYYWNVQCDCGNTRQIQAIKLRHNQTKSCGCILKEQRHGHTGPDGKHSLTYFSWMSMRQRCLYPKHVAFHNYGGRGITICKRWNDFKNFLTDMGERPCKELTLDRIDNNGNYEPSNCKWSTKSEQNENQRPRP